MEQHSGNAMNDRDVIIALFFSNQFRAPFVKMGILDYMASFEDAIQTVESGELVHGLHLARLDMEQKLNAKPLEWKEVMLSIDRYLPLLFSMTWSLTQQAGLVKLNQPTIFEWKGSFSAETTSSKREEFAFELIMTLHTLAMSHIAQAKMQLDDENNRDLAAAGKSYLAASNILDYLGSNLLSRWKFTGIRPPEAQETICQAFSHYYQACAQKCAIIKAITKSGDTLSTPPGTLAKLCMAVTNFCQQSLSLFERLSLENLNKVNSSFLSEIRYSLELYMAMTCYYEGKAQLLKYQCGVAVAYFRQAKNGLKEQKQVSSSSSNHLFHPFQSGMPKLIDTYVSTSSGIRKILIEILHVSEVAERDNNLIYFQPIPAPDDMPPLPDNAMIMAKTVYVEPRSGDFVKFQYPVIVNDKNNNSNEVSPDKNIAATGNIESSNATATANNNSSNTLNNESNKIFRSDSDYARELQRKLDAGEDC